MGDPNQPLDVPAQREANTIEVIFVGAPLDYNTVTTRPATPVNPTVRVQRGNGGDVPGTIVRLPNNTVRWVALDPSVLPVDRYRVTLVADAAAAITSQQHTRLDGEPSNLPSGDDHEGGDFVFTMRVS